MPLSRSWTLVFARFGIFETMRTYSGGCPYALGPHLERLWDGAEAIGVQPFFTADEVRREIREAYSASGFTEASVNILVTTWCA